MDREQADRVGVLLLRDRLQLARADRVLLADEADEALDVTAAQLLVRAREPRELAHVRVAAPAVPLREHGEVVVVLGDDLLAEPLERERAERRGEPLVALAEGAEEPRVALGELLRAAPRSSPANSGRRAAARRSSTSASFETPTNGEASTVTSASSS